MPAPPDIRVFIVGIGIQIPGHTTLQALDAMGACSRLYSIVQEPPSVWLPSGKSSDTVVNILGMYQEGNLRRDNYARVADTIFGATSEFNPLGYVTYGNPMSYDSVAQQLASMCSKAGLSLSIVPGISSVDTLLCDIGIDMAPGLQILEAAWMMSHNIRLRADTPAMLLQVGAVDTLRTRYRTQPAANSLTVLIDYLAQSYPENHEVYLVRSSNRVRDRARVHRAPLSQLRLISAGELLGGSMYIPWLHPPRPITEKITQMVKPLELW